MLCEHSCFIECYSATKDHIDPVLFSQLPGWRGVGWCVCVCVRERERERHTKRERETHTHKERERERQGFQRPGKHHKCIWNKKTVSCGHR